MRRLSQKKYESVIGVPVGKGGLTVAEATTPQTRKVSRNTLKVMDELLKTHKLEVFYAYDSTTLSFFVDKRGLYR